MEHIQEVADVILDGNIEKLKELASNPATSVLKVWIAKAAAEGIRKGDMHPLEIILNRVLGRPREDIRVTADIDAKEVLVLTTTFRGLPKDEGQS